jgi:hypothetical protein
MPATIDDNQRLAALQQFPLEGSCKGRFAFGSVPADFAQSLLPAELVLAPQNYTEAGQHPLLLMFNDTNLNSNPNVEKHILDGILPEMKLHYYEFIVMLPYVRFSDSQYESKGPYCYLPVLYLDSYAAVAGGRLFWEFNKEMAEFTVDDSSYTVKASSTGDALLSATTGIMSLMETDSTVAGFEDISPMLVLPVIEHGPYGYVSSVYEIDFDNIDIAPAGLELINQASSYLPEGTFSSPSILEQPLGAFYINYNWALSYIEFIKF